MTGFRLDPTDERHARALARLASEQIGWLGSTGRDGYPHAVPVWFVWRDDAVFVFSQPRSAKTRNLAADPRAAFHLEAGHDGEQFHVLQGTAELSPRSTVEWLPELRDAYLAKYADGVAGQGWTIDDMAEDYSVVIIVRPHKLIAW